MADIWVPYRPPQQKPLGWRVGPLTVPVDLASGSGAGLDASVEVDQTVAMDLAACSGAGIAGDVTIQTIENVTVNMLPAISTGAGLAASAEVDQTATMNLATGTGAALVPTLTINNPPQFVDLGTNDRGTTTSSINAAVSGINATAGDYLLLWVCVVSNGTPIFGTPSLSGVSFTDLHTSSGTGYILRLYGASVSSTITNATTGTYAITFSGGTTAAFFTNSLVYSGASFNSAGGINTTAGSTASMTVTAPPAGSTVVGIMCGTEIAGSFTSPTGVHTREFNSQNVCASTSGDVFGTGSNVTFSCANNGGAVSPYPTPYAGVWVILD